MKDKKENWMEDVADIFRANGNVELVEKDGKNYISLNGKLREPKGLFKILIDQQIELKKQMQAVFEQFDLEPKIDPFLQSVTAVYRTPSSEPKPGFYFDEERECYMEGDDLLRQRIIEKIRKVSNER